MRQISRDEARIVVQMIGKKVPISEIMEKCSLSQKEYDSVIERYNRLLPGTKRKQRLSAFANVSRGTSIRTPSDLFLSAKWV